MKWAISILFILAGAAWVLWFIGHEGDFGVSAAGDTIIGGCFIVVGIVGLGLAADAGCRTRWDR